MDTMDSSSILSITSIRSIPSISLREGVHAMVTFFTIACTRFLRDQDSG